MPAARKITKAAFYLFFISCVVVAALEIAGRFFLLPSYYAFPRDYFRKNASCGYELSPDFKGTYTQPEFSISIDTNSLGMRDQAQDQCFDCDRVLGLGDSIAFGIGVELADTYLSIIQERLNARPGGRKTVVFKAGVPGYSLFNQRAYLEQKGFSLKPSLVIVQFWWDDLGVDRLTYQAEAGFLSSGKSPSFAQFRAFLNSHFRSYALLRRAYAALFHKPLFAPLSAGYGRDPAGLRERFAVTVRQFKAIEETCKKQQARCLFLLVPARQFIESPEGKNTWDAWRAYALESGVTALDLAPALAEASRRGEKLFFTIDPHLTAQGHRVVADALWEHLKASAGAS